jgi:hypothetical protein
MGVNGDKIFNRDVSRIETVRSFVYLDSLANRTNDVTGEFSKRIQSANRRYFGLIKYFKSRFLHPRN